MSAFEFLGIFDWIIGPLIYTLEMAVYDMGHTFYVGLDSGWSGAWCERLLKKYGVRVYGRRIGSDDIFFEVSKKQAKWAECVLLKAGVPLKYHLFCTDNRRYLK